MDVVLLLHVGTGAVAVAAGLAALLLPKGRPLHRLCGRVFAGTMIVSALAGSFLALMKPEYITLLAGSFTIYLVGSSLMTVRPVGERPVATALICMLCAISIAVAGSIWASEALASQDGTKTGYGADVYLVFAVLAALSGAADLSVAIRRKLHGKQRLARHLWRMTLALYIAVGSLFTGPGASVFSREVRESGVLVLPEFIVLGLMVIWLARTYLRRSGKSRMPSPRATT